MTCETCNYKRTRQYCKLCQVKTGNPAHRSYYVEEREKKATSPKLVKFLAAVKAGDAGTALGLAKGFYLTFNKEEQKLIARAAEMLNLNGAFYERLGYNTEEEVDKAMALIKVKYEKMLGGE